LSEFSVRSAPAENPDISTAVPLARASASSGETRWDFDIRGAAMAIDGRHDTRWDIYSLQGRPHTLWVEPAMPIVGHGRTRLTITLSFRNAQGTGLGRFRLAAQAAPGPGPALAPRFAKRVGAAADDWPPLATVHTFRCAWALCRDELLKYKSDSAKPPPVHDLLLSLAYYALGQFDLADRTYERAVGPNNLAGASREVLEFAIQVVGRRIFLYPRDARLRVQRACFMLRCERWQEQRAELKVADQLAPDQWIEWAQDFEWLLQLRADDAAIDGDWRGSERALNRLRALRPEVDDWWWFSALVLAEARDNDELRRVSGEMLRRFGNTTDSHVADRTALAGLVLPGSYDTGQHTALINRFISANQGEPWFRLTRALAGLRSGRLKEAADDARECMKRQEVFLPEAAGFILAMLHQKAGRTEEAGRQLNQARDRILRGIKKDTREKEWKRAILVDLLRREAEEAITIKKPAVSK
jgi:hypothetical protein